MAKAAAQLTLFPELPAAQRLRADARRSRLFFALWPDAHLREQLAAAASLIPPGSAARAHRVRPERYHLTLAFFGALLPAQVEAAKRAGAAVRAASFDLRLDSVGYFPGARAAWIGPQTLPPPLAALKAALDAELLRFGLPVEAGSFRPHVTALRGLDDAPDAPPVQIDWRVRELVLVRSILKPGANRYIVVGRWPLGL